MQFRGGLAGRGGGGGEVPILVSESGGGNLNLRPGEGIFAGDLGRVIGEIELGVAAAEAVEGGVEGPGGLLVSLYF